jgi:hypothetical protein
MFTLAPWVAILPLLAVPVRAADPVGVYGMIEHITVEPASGDPMRIQLWGVFAFADGPKGEGYGAVKRGYMYYACPSAQLATCRNDWADLLWFKGTGKGVGYGLRTEPIGRLRPETERPASPDPYPVRGGLVKVESKDPAYVDLVARLKAALAK